MNDLADDLKALSNNLPCEFTSIFEANTKSIEPENIATAYYSTEQIALGYPIIEINPQYFLDFSISERRLILLHEIIHACQRTNELHDLIENIR